MKLFLSLCQKIVKEASKKVTQPSIALPVAKTVPKIKLHRTFREKFVYNVFGKYLLTTNTVTSGLLMVIGDFAAQEIEYRRGENPLRRDWHRSGKTKSFYFIIICSTIYFVLGIMFIVGAIQGPMHHYFYMWIDSAIKTVNLVNVTKKILLDQCIMSPIFITTFFYSAGWLSRQSTRQCNDELKSKFVKVYMASFRI